MENKLLLWDIDGTLMTCYNDGTKALNETFRRRTGKENACGEVKVGTAMDSALVDSIMKKFGIPKEEKTKIIAEFGIILEEILEANRTKRVLPGIKEILEALMDKKNIYMGILTSNFKIGADLKLASVGLDGYFSFGGYGDFPGEKWDAALMAIKKAEEISGLKFKNENIYIIGDTSYDVKCARKIGVESISVATGWMDYASLKEENSDYFFKSLENTHEFLEIMMR